MAQPTDDLLLAHLDAVREQIMQQTSAAIGRWLRRRAEFAATSTETILLDRLAEDVETGRWLRDE